jgi:hypothetical protein
LKNLTLRTPQQKIKNKKGKALPSEPHIFQNKQIRVDFSFKFHPVYFCKRNFHPVYFAHHQITIYQLMPAYIQNFGQTPNTRKYTKCFHLIQDH